MEVFNKIIEDNIHEYQIESIDELIFIRKLVAIIDRHPVYVKYPKAKHFVKINKSFQYSYNFFKSFCPRYADYLLSLKEQGIFQIEKKKDSYAYSICEDGKHMIYLPIQNNIGDTYSITHETIHDITVEDFSSLTRSFFCEVFSLLAEILQKDYFERTIQPKEYRMNNLGNIIGVYQKKTGIKLELLLIETYLEYGSIDFFHLAEIYQSLNKTEQEIASYYLSHLVEEGNLEYGFEQRYIVGYLFACYMHDQILKNPKKIQEFIELNDSLNEIPMDDFLDYLGLEYNENTFLDLTQESYDILEKSLVYELKRR